MENLDEVRGIVFNVQRYSTDDGPGIRSTVFLKGCPLHCPWCANPESMKSYPEIFHRDISCVQCGKCASRCPQKAITFKEKGIRIDHDSCVRCGKCTLICAQSAVQFMGEEKTVGQVFKTVMKDLDYYNNTGGGVTCSGGEALMQPEFVAALFQKLQAAGVHTCLDTTGYAGRASLDKVLPYTDLVYFDLKHMNSQTHESVTGVPTEPIHENFRYIAERGVAITVRIPFIPGFNDSDENIEATAAFVSSILPGNEIGLLPYHRYGMGKYDSLDKEYPMGEIEKPSEEATAHAKEIFERYGLRCIIKG